MCLRSVGFTESTHGSDLKRSEEPFDGAKRYHGDKNLEKLRACFSKVHYMP